MRGPVGERAVTLRHGIDIERVAAERAHRAEVRAEFGIGDDEFVVVTAANFRPQKDYPNLLGAARLLADRNVGGAHRGDRSGPAGRRDQGAARVAWPRRPGDPHRFPQRRHTGDGGVRRVHAGVEVGGPAGGGDGGAGDRAADRGHRRRRHGRGTPRRRRCAAGAAGRFGVVGRRDRTPGHRSRAVRAARRRRGALGRRSSRSSERSPRSRRPTSDVARTTLGCRRGPRRRTPGHVAEPRLRRRSTSVPPRPTIATRSSRCCSVRWAATATPGIPSCSRGSTTPTGSARRRCGWPPTVTGSWRSGR